MLRPRPVRPPPEPRRMGSQPQTQSDQGPTATSSRYGGKEDLEGTSVPKDAPRPGEQSHEKSHPITQAGQVTAGKTTVRPARRRATVPPPETGRPETAKEFVKRIKRVVLHGPHKGQREGERPEQQPESMTRHNTVDGPPTLRHDTRAGDDSVRNTPVPPLTTQESQFLEFLADNTEGINLLHSLQGRYSEDKFFGEILANLKHYKNFLVKDGLVFLQDSKRSLLCIPNVLMEGRSVRELVIRHAHSLLAHLGTHRTLSLLRDHMWWKSMVSDVQAYCDSCMTCK